MKNISIIIICCLLGCNHHESDKRLEENAITIIDASPKIQNDKKVSWKYQIDKILDSLTIKKIDLEDAYQFVIKNFIDTNQYYFEPINLNLDFFLKMIQFDRFNDFILVQLKHPHGSKMENDIEVILLSKQRKVLSKDTLLGNRYWIGTTKITDWNNDGINELVYKYDAPVSNVPIMSKYEEVYGILKGNVKLKKIFELETEAFNCGPGDSSLITRTYSFEGHYKIKLKQEDFIVDCNSGKEENKKQEKRKIAESVRYLKWNESDNKYE